MNASTIVDVVRQHLPDVELEDVESLDVATVWVPRRQVLAVCRVLRDEPILDFSFLAEVTAVDRLPQEPRFEVVYHLVCLGQHGPRRADAVEPSTPKRLRVKVKVPGSDPHVETVSSLWPSAGWPEREVWDLFGIVFDGHPDLRRILMPDDWDGHPLRKDHPVQVSRRTRISESLQVSQEEFLTDIAASRVGTAADVPTTPAPVAEKES